MILIVGLAIGIFFVLRYADRIKKDPTKSLVYELKAENEARFRTSTDADDVTLTGMQKTVLAVFEVNNPTYVPPSIPAGFGLFAGALMGNMYNA